jgi:hypothetical protein
MKAAELRAISRKLSTYLELHFDDKDARSIADRCGEIAALLDASPAYQRRRARELGSGSLEDRVLRIASGAPERTRDRSHRSRMLTPKDHRELAARCLRLAKTCTKPSVAEQLMMLAASYSSWPSGRLDCIRDPPATCASAQGP